MDEYVSESDVARVAGHCRHTVSRRIRTPTPLPVRWERGFLPTSSGELPSPRAWGEGSGMRG
jgi:hypothetical protein